MSTPSIPGVDRNALADAIREYVIEKPFVNLGVKFPALADAAIAYIAAHQEPRACTCGAKYDMCPDCAADVAYEEGWKDAVRHECALPDHDDEWVAVGSDAWLDLPTGVRLRTEWEQGAPNKGRFFVHRDDLPGEPVDKRVEVAAQWLAEYIGNGEDGTANEWRNEAKSLLEALDNGEINE